MGLPIVAKILEDHGGGMELVDNPAGRGGQVRMWIPKTKHDCIGRSVAGPAEIDSSGVAV